VMLAAEPTRPPWRLTVREHEVLTGVVAGMTNPDIAAWLGLTRRTVATHVERILDKLAAPTRAGAAALATAGQELLAPLPGGTALAATAVGRVTTPVSGTSLVPASARLRSRAAPAKRPIRLGSIYPSDGPRRWDAIAMHRGASLAVREINSRGGVAGRVIEHFTVDVSGDLRDDLYRSVRSLQDLEVDAITLGNVSPALGADAISLAAESSAPLIHSMVSPSIAEQVHDNPAALGHTFQVCATETAYISGFLRTLDLLVVTKQWQPPSRRIVALTRSIDADDLLPVAMEQSDSGRWQLDQFIRTDDVGVPWPEHARRIAECDPAAVFVCTYVEHELRQFLTAIHEVAVSPLVYTVWTPSIPDFARRMGTLADGLLWATVVGTYEDPVSGRFRRRFREVFGADAGSGSAAIHYDMTHMLSSVWSGLDRPWDFDAVARGLRHGVYRGAAGPYYFGGRGQRALSYPDDTMDASLAHAHLVHQIQGGRSRVIAPFPLGQSTFRSSTR